MLRIQQAPMILNKDRRPYPICVDEDGTIGQQSHHGYVGAVRLIGFQKTIVKDQVDLWLRDWFKDPQSAVGMYPIVSNLPFGEGDLPDGEELQMGVLESVIETVEEVPDVRAADIP